MRVLVTRPQKEALATVARLRQRAHQPLVAPVLEIVATAARLPDGPFDAVIATSAQAIEALRSSDAKRLAELPLLGVGERTVEAARAHGFLNVAPATANAAQLVAALREAGKTFRNVLYLAGRDRKPLIEQTFENLGLNHSVAVMYEARPVAALPEAAQHALVAGEIDAVLHFSRRSAEIFLHLVQQAGCLEALRRSRQICLSADVAIPFHALGLSAEIAARPESGALFETLETR